MIARLLSQVKAADNADEYAYLAQANLIQIAVPPINARQSGGYNRAGGAPEGVQRSMVFDNAG